MAENGLVWLDKDSRLQLILRQCPAQMTLTHRMLNGDLRIHAHAYSCQARPLVELRLKASELIDRLRRDKLLSYLIEEGREGDFCEVYNAQRKLYEQGRQVDACMSVVKFWLEECQNCHNECRNQADDWKAGFPSRLIDLGEPSRPNGLLKASALPKDIRVVGVRSEDKLQYIAVSYRWPDNPCANQQLSSATHDDFVKGYSTKSLPTLFCDAFIVARMLGFRYVWIDALCIMQGHKGDWHREASKMGSIYGNAVLTLAFGDSSRTRHSRRKEGQEQCVGEEPSNNDEDSSTWRSCSLHDAARGADTPFIRGSKISERDKRSPESIYCWLESNQNFPTRPNCELDQRGWTFQERLLSVRVLTMTTNGLYWDCCRLSAADTRPSGFRGDFSPRFRDSNERKIKTKLLVGARLSVRHVPSDLYLLWRRILQDYSSREFSHDEDRIIAIEGVVQRMRVAVTDQYYLGVWKGDIVRSLIWFCQTRREDLPTKEMYTVTAPSWSWASVSFPIQYRLWHPFATHADHNIEFVSPCATLEYISVTPSNTSFSEYTGVIALSGRVAQLPVHLLSTVGSMVFLDPRPKSEFPLVRSTEEPPNLLLSTKTSQVFLDQTQNGNSSTYSSTKKPRSKWQDLLGDTIYVMPVLKGGYSKSLQAYYYLILHPCTLEMDILGSSEQPDEMVVHGYRRLGILVVDTASSQFCSEDPDSCHDERCAETIRLKEPNGGLKCFTRHSYPVVTGRILIY